MSSIDWSKAPVNATHARPYTGGVDFYRRNDGGMWTYWNENRWDYAVGTDESCCVARPVPWSGEGLPPVGTVCEYIGIASSVPRGALVDIVTHLRYRNGDMAVYAYRCPDNPIIGQAIEGKFRPLRTPEQIAEDERNATVLQIMENVGLRRDQAERIYDAGYRK